MAGSSAAACRALSARSRCLAATLAASCATYTARHMRTASTLYMPHSTTGSHKETTHHFPGRNGLFDYVAIHVYRFHSLLHRLINIFHAVRVWHTLQDIVDSSLDKFLQDGILHFAIILPYTHATTTRSISRISFTGDMTGLSCVCVYVMCSTEGGGWGGVHVLPASLAPFALSPHSHWH